MEGVFSFLSSADRECVSREREREREKGRERAKTLSCQLLWQQQSREREAERERGSPQLAQRRLHPPAWCSSTELTLQSSDSSRAGSPSSMDPGRSIQHEISSLKGTPLAFFFFFF